MRFVEYMGIHYPDVTLADLNHTHIQAYLNHKMDEGVKGSTVKQYYLALHSAFAYAVKMDMLTQHPNEFTMSIPSGLLFSCPHGGGETVWQTESRVLPLRSAAIRPCWSEVAGQADFDAF